MFGINGAGGPLAFATQPKPGINWLGVLSDALSGAAGKPGAYAAMLGQQRQMQMEEQIYQNHQQSEMQRQMQMYDYQRKNPNDEVTQYMVASGIDPKSPQGQAIYSQALTQKTNPFVAMDVQQPDGSTVKQYVRPPMAPTAPIGALSDTPPQAQGGPTPPASGGFPRPRRKQNGRLP